MNWRLIIIFIHFLFSKKMNLSGTQAMKQQTDQLMKDVVQMTTYRPDRPADLFQYYHPQIRKQFVDAYNLCRIWVEGILYWKGLYPQEAFELKTAYARKVFVVKSKLLRQYLDKFFESVCQNFQYIDFIEVQLYEQNQHHQKIKVQAQRFYITFSEKLSKMSDLHEVKRKGLNTIQKEIQYKRFLGKMEEQLNTGYYRSSNAKTSFQLLMGYKWEHRNKNNKHRLNLLNKWTEIEPKQAQDKNILNHAGTGQLEIYCERFIPHVENQKMNVE